jgi:hypothetical protein
MRLPLDYNVVQQEEGSFIEESLVRIKKTLGWCRANGLRMSQGCLKSSGPEA